MKSFLAVCSIVCVSGLLLPFNSNANFFYMSKEIMNCQDKFKSPTDYTLCLDAAYVQVERELMTWETNVEIILRDLADKDATNNPVTLYKSSIRHFNKYKKATCKWQYISMLPDITAAITLSKECEIYMAKDRIEKLKELSELKF